MNRLPLIALLLLADAASAQIPAPLTIVANPKGCPAITVGVAYSCQLFTVLGGTPPYTVTGTWDGGPLPKGLTLDNTGKLTGTLPPTGVPTSLKFTVAGKTVTIPIEKGNKHEPKKTNPVAARHRSGVRA